MNIANGQEVGGKGWGGNQNFCTVKTWRQKSWIFVDYYNLRIIISWRFPAFCTFLRIALKKHLWNGGISLSIINRKFSPVTQKFILIFKTTSLSMWNYITFVPTPRECLSQKSWRTSWLNNSEVVNFPSKLKFTYVYKSNQYIQNLILVIKF